MDRARPLPKLLPGGSAGLLLALVALAMQLAAASVVPSRAAAGRLAAASICHGDGAASDRGDAPAQHRAPPCAVCPLCQAIAHTGVLLSAPMLATAAPARLIARAVALPASRAPPGRAAFAASARGPPVRS